ncbi:MAG: hypothetical protein Fur0044_10540 [Anaerolineae bacterium]
MERLLGTIFILVIPGVFILLRGIWLLKGGGKGAYLVTHIYAGRVYAYIPFGIMALVWAMGTVPQSPDIQSVFIFVGLGFGVLGGFFYIFQPSFLKPAWLRWLEQEHGDIMPILQQEAQAMGLKNWEKRVATQVGLEEWVEEVRRKRGLK